MRSTKRAFWYSWDAAFAWGSLRPPPRSRRHDLVALQIHDAIEGQATKLGWLAGWDPESARLNHIGTGSLRWRKRYEKAVREHQEDIEGYMKRSGVDHAMLRTDRPYVQPLMQLFDRRG